MVDKAGSSRCGRGQWSRIGFRGCDPYLKDMHIYCLLDLGPRSPNLLLKARDTYTSRNLLCDYPHIPNLGCNAITNSTWWSRFPATRGTQDVDCFTVLCSWRSYRLRVSTTTSSTGRRTGRGTTRGCLPR